MSNRRKADPSGTAWISKKFDANFRKRWDWLRGEITQYVGTDDSLGLGTSPFSVNARYAFQTSSEKVEQFQEWLKQKEEAGILTSTQGPVQAVAGDRYWTDTYIESSYKKGMADAYVAGGYEAVTGLSADNWLASSFFGAIHADRVGLLYTRTFNDLKGVTDAMDKSMSDVLAQGMAEGKNPNVIARELNKQVEGIGYGRSKLIARTEVVRANAEAALNTFESFGEVGLTIEVEWSFAQDNRVCPKCIRAGSTATGGTRVYTIDEARGLIPLHPNCRCVWIPVTESTRQMP